MFGLGAQPATESLLELHLGKREEKKTSMAFGDQSNVLQFGQLCATNSHVRKVFKARSEPAVETTAASITLTVSPP